MPGRNRTRPRVASNRSLPPLCAVTSRSRKAPFVASIADVPPPRVLPAPLRRDRPARCGTRRPSGRASAPVQQSAAPSFLRIRVDPLLVDREVQHLPHQCQHAVRQHGRPALDDGLEEVLYVYAADRRQCRTPQPASSCRIIPASSRQLRFFRLACLSRSSVLRASNVRSWVSFFRGRSRPIVAS